MAWSHAEQEACRAGRLRGRRVPRAAAVSYSTGSLGGGTTGFWGSIAVAFVSAVILIAWFDPCPGARRPSTTDAGCRPCFSADDRRRLH